MPLFIASLNSGSNGNCYYVGNETEAVLIDAGISCRETERRMKLLGLPLDRVKGIFISHEHSDHISGASGLSKRYEIPVYITPYTHSRCNLPIAPHLKVSFKANVEVQVGELSVMPFPKYHDACDPHSFTVRTENTCVGVFTDIGKPCKDLVHHFKKCDAAFLEANYDEVMLEQGRYPQHLKNRIRGGHGHLSNREALEVFTEHKQAAMSHLLLAHLSKENNNPGLVHELFSKHSRGTEIVVASRYKASNVFTVRGSGRVKELIMPSKVKKHEGQLALF